ncbi:MAG: hypothetical protein D6683_14510 [Actinomyces sp.]|nr:MAG: hypothetical protein D6683_14510 [Actinomyces sp.]
MNAASPSTLHPGPPVATPLRRRLAGDRGQVGGIEVLPFGFLILVAAVLIIANAWAVVDARLAVTSAAHEGVRAFVEAPDGTSAAARAQARARETLVALGRDPGRAGVGPVVAERGFVRCSRVTLEVSYRVPAVTVPFVGGFGSLLTVRGRASELVDPYRSGVPGRATC